MIPLPKSSFQSHLSHISPYTLIHKPTCNIATSRSFIHPRYNTNFDNIETSPHDVPAKRLTENAPNRPPNVSQPRRKPARGRHGKGVFGHVHRIGLHSNTIRAFPVTLDLGDSACARRKVLHPSSLVDTDLYVV